tara:strand:- start:469 stop:1050 length:582 start_codon:yes stop_codon:yes gene_type:complete
MKKKNLEELIDSAGSIISGDYTINHDFGSDKTSDQYEKLTRQGASNFYGYRRWWGEDDENKPYSDLADKLQNHPRKFYEILKRNKKEGSFDDYFTNESIKEQEDLMKDMLEDIVKSRFQDGVISKEDHKIKTLEEYSDEDPILVKWVLLVKELWLERQNNDRITILNSLIEDVNFEDVEPNIKNILINKINGE